MAINGNLKTFYLSSLLQLLSNDKKTGILELTDGNDIVQVFLREGTIINAFGSSRVERLTNYLRSEGIITEEQLEKCMKISAHTEKKIGMVLVEQGYISAETLENLLHRQIEQTLFSLFLWEQGEFHYRDQSFDLSGQIITSFDTMELVLEASRRDDEISEIKKRVPGDQDVPRQNPDCTEQQKSKLNTAERAVLSLVNGKRTVKRVIADSGYDELKVYKTLFSLFASGLIFEENQILKRPMDLEEETVKPDHVDAASIDDPVQTKNRAAAEKQAEPAGEIFNTPDNAQPDHTDAASIDDPVQTKNRAAAEEQTEPAGEIFSTPDNAQPDHDQGTDEPDEMILELEPEPDIDKPATDEQPSAQDSQVDLTAFKELPGKTVVKIDGRLLPENEPPDMKSTVSTDQLTPVNKSKVADALRQHELKQDQITSAQRQISLEDDLTEDEEKEYTRAKKRMLKRILVGAGALLSLLIVVLLLKPILFPKEPEQKIVQAPVTVPKPVKKKKPVKQETQKPASQEEKKSVPDTTAAQQEPALDFFQDQKGWVSINLPAGFTASEQAYEDRTSVSIRYGNNIMITLSIVPDSSDWNAEDNMYAAIVRMQESGSEQVQKYNTIKNAGCPGYVLHFSSTRNQKAQQIALYHFVCFNKSARLEVACLNWRIPSGRKLCRQVYAAIEESLFIYQ